MSISLEITASVYFKGHLPKHFKVLIFDFPFSGFSLLLSVTECLPGRHAWLNLRVWMKKITQLRKKCYSFFFFHNAQKEKYHCFAEQLIFVEHFAVFFSVFLKNRFYKFEFVSHLSNCGNRQLVLSLRKEKAYNLPSTRLVFNYS